MNTYTSHAIALVIGGLIVAAACAYIKLRPSLPSLPSAPSKELANEKPETLVGRPLVVYPDRVKRKLGLPEEVVKDASKRVVGSTQVKASEYSHTVSGVASLDTGEVVMYTRQDRLPWMGFSRKGTLGLAYGIQDDGEATTRINASYMLMSVKRLNIGLTGDIATSGRAFVGVGGEIRF